MPSLKEIRNRIRSVQNTQKITRAMKLVAAAKLRRAQDNVVAARPYALKLREMMATLAQVVDPEQEPLFEAREMPSKCLLIPITSDRGLCGGFNSTILRQLTRFVRENRDAWEGIGVAPVGRKGREGVRRLDMDTWLDMQEVLPDRTAPSVRHAVGVLCDLFVSGEVDRVYLVYNEFQSALTQVVRTEQFLPLSAEAFSDVELPDVNVADMIFEPAREELLAEMIPRYLESQLYRALLESEASEMGARMTAMDNATKNAGDLIDRLTLQMNRARQAAITTELMEITSGAESLKG